MSYARLAALVDNDLKEDPKSTLDDVVYGNNAGSGDAADEC